MFAFYVLICLASLFSQPLVSLNIYNQCQAINLTFPVYFIHGGRWNVTPDQEINVNTVMRNYLEPDFRKDILKGALMYGIQRKHAKYDKFIQDKSKQVQLLVVWCGERTKELHVRALLIEHDKKLDKDKLRKLYQKYWHLFKARANPTISNWLLYDAIVSITTIKTMNECHRWDIFISKGIRNNVERPLWINVKR
jgi:hypothetical protein